MGEFIAISVPKEALLFHCNFSPKKNFGHVCAIRARSLQSHLISFQLVIRNEHYIITHNIHQNVTHNFASGLSLKTEKLSEDVQSLG